MWVWGGGCRCGVVWVYLWGGGCGCGHGESNSCTKHYIDSINSSLFVQSVIFCHSLCGLLNILEGVGKCVGVVVRSCGFGEVLLRRWVWGGGCGGCG